MQLNKTASNKSSPALKTMSKLRASTFGLSQCELGNTILGKIARRSSHHIVFEKMPNRPANINTIWYNKH